VITALRQTGYVEGQNVHIAFRWAEGRYERFPELAAELAHTALFGLAYTFSGWLQ
jgi:putative ABC transport system substrate-binding protein